MSDPVSVIVPYKNSPALIGYYFGVFSLIPCIGVVLALGAVPLGIFGLRVASRNPQAHGRAHAWTAIILGSLVLLAHAAFFVLVAMDA
jgi:hypothetical protein